MEKSLVVIFCLFATLAQAQYRITKAKIVGWSICAVGGASDGMVEGYTFDGRKSFERKYGVDPHGYFGSESWRMVYRAGEPANGFKSQFHQTVGAWDFYHHADDLRKVGYIGGGVVVGIGGAKTNTKWWHYGIDFAVSFAVSATTKAAAMHWIRN